MDAKAAIENRWRPSFFHCDHCVDVFLSARFRRHRTRSSVPIMKPAIGISVLALPLALLLSGASGALARSKPDAQNYPVRPVRIVVPTPAGGPTDFTARVIAQRMTDAWGQQVIIDNRGGAGGIIGHDLAAKAIPDGYTLIFSTAAGLIINPLLHKVPYDSFRDLAPISLGSINPQLLFSNPEVPATNMKELIALAKARPKQLNCGSAGNGTPNHLGCELLKSMAGIDVVHVPYKGSPAAVTDVISGQIQFMLNSIPTVLPLAKAGKIRALGVSSAKRSPAVPEIPAIAETVPGFEYVQWFAMLAPAGTPAAVVNKISTEMAKMIADPPFAQRLVNLGAEPQSSTPAELSAYMRKDSERWARVIKALKAAGTRFEL
jgi:tripartite-type tricarboxylate transporter receptor subunit TctC